MKEKHIRLRRVFIACLAVSLLLFSLCFARAAYYMNENCKLNTNYWRDPDKPQYPPEPPLDPKALAQYGTYEADGLVEQPAGNWTRSVRLPVTVRYYAAPDAKSTPAKELKKGTLVTAIPGNSGYRQIFGYGIEGFPAAQAKGWRIVRPFSTDGDPASVEGLPYYYAKLSDLKAVAESVYHENRMLRLYAKQQSLKKSRYIRSMVLEIDDFLCGSGMYLSPDLYYPLFDWVSAALLTAGMLALSACFAVSRLISRS